RHRRPAVRAPGRAHPGRHRAGRTFGLPALRPMIAVSEKRGIRGERYDGDTFTQEVPVSWNASIRQIHRWLSMAFTFGFVANLVAVGLQPEQPIVWVGMLALIPLLLLLATGLYL